MKPAIQALGAALALFAAPALAAGQPAARPITVMVVGMVHLSNPGRDYHDAHVDDVLAPRRQAQIRAVTDGLARFRPTVVAVEWPKDITDTRYTQYRAGTLKPSRNETVQLGFRLAKQAGLRHVDGIDYMADFPYPAVQAYAKAHGQEAILTAANAAMTAEIDREQALLKSGTIGDLLRHMNTRQTIDTLHSFYREMLRVGGGDDQPGATLLTAWFGRNAQICARLVQTLKPGDRAVVMFGAGHAFYLRQCVSEMPGYRLVEANDYLPR